MLQRSPDGRFIVNRCVSGSVLIRECKDHLDQARLRAFPVGWGSSADEATLLVFQPTCCFDPYCVPRRLGSRGGLAARQPEPCPRDLPNRGSGHDEGRPGGRAGHRRGPQEERVQQGAGCEMKDNARKSEGAAGNLKECQLP